MAALHLCQPVVLRPDNHQHIAAGVVALADLIPMHQGPAQHHVGKLRVPQGAVDRLAKAATERAEFQFGELVAVVIAAGSTQQPANQRPGTQRMPQRHRINAGTAHGASAETGGGQLGLADAP